MNPNSKMFAIETSDYGPFVRVLDRSLADEFDDFLTESFFILYDCKFNDESVEFLFGVAASKTKLSKIIDDFLRELPEA